MFSSDICLLQAYSPRLLSLSFLQKYMNKALGPILIVTGMVLIELIRFNISGKGISSELQQRVDKMGMWGALRSWRIVRSVVLSRFGGVVFWEPVPSCGSI